MPPGPVRRRPAPVDGSLGQQQLLELGAVETLAEAVRRFPLERRLQQRALPALCRLCEAEGVRAGAASGLTASVGLGVTIVWADCTKVGIPFFWVIDPPLLPLPFFQLHNFADRPWKKSQKKK